MDLKVVGASFGIRKLSARAASNSRERKVSGHKNRFMMDFNTNVYIKYMMVPIDGVYV